MNRALSAVEASQILGCSRVSLLKPWWRRRHGIAAIRIGRRLVFLEDELRAWLRAHREPWGSTLDLTEAGALSQLEHARDLEARIQ
jgi:hypothetical protein